jgi:OmcA/MtrC family decaheme c-type cytochrome
MALCLTAQHKKFAYGPRDKAFYANPALVAFVRPGLAITINSASISSAGAITVNFTLTDPSGLPLDVAGVNTPGSVALTYFAAYIPKGQEQYVSYTTASASGAKLGTVTRPTFEEGSGTLTAAGTAGSGQYQYVMKTTAPAGFDATVTTTIGMSGIRDLTSFNLGTSYAGATFNFVPNGSAVTVTRDVIKTGSCNSCHDQLAFHGGHAFGMEECVMCHQPQNVDPVTGNSLDLKVMAHKIHMGSSLPSVVAGTPYQITGYQNSVNDFSTVVDPADVHRCEVCHSQTTGAAQAKAFMQKPTRAACGACHDDVNFATGTNHAGGFQMDDNECATCHIPQGEIPFDASILGAHVVASDTSVTYPQNPDTLIAGEAIKITGVTNTAPGQKPVVAFTVKDTNGKVLPLANLEDISFTLGGPTSDYGYTTFGSATTPGYDSEDGSVATCDASSNCTFTFQNAIPAKATGTYAVAVESEILENVLPGTNQAQQVESGTANQVFYFSVDGSPVAARRTVVQETNCNQCHIHLTGHGARRNDPEYCIMCHNPSLTDASTRAQSTNPTILAQAPQALNFNFMIHRIHTGVNLAAMGASFIEITHNGRVDNFSNVLYPAMSPSGSATYTQNCSLCHVNSSEQNLPDAMNQVTNGQYYINPTPPVSSSCSGCHASKAEAAHFATNLNSIGEACDVCHASGGQFSVGSVHAK